MSEKTLGEAAYEQLADRYAEAILTKPHNAYYDRPAVLSLLPDLAGLYVLDAGCGPGVYAEQFVERGASVVGVDVTPRMIELAAQRLGDRADFRIADLSRPLDFAGDGEFDVVVSPLVLDYLYDWRPVFREFARVLKPGGVFVASFGHPANDYYRYYPEGRYFDIEQVSWVERGFAEPHVTVHHYRRSLMDAINPLMEAGFVLERLLEPLPVAEFEQADPAHFEELMRKPVFLCFRARKTFSL